MKKYESMSKTELLKVIGDQHAQISTLKRREEKYRTLTEGLKDVVFRVSLDGKLSAAFSAGFSCFVQPDRIIPPDKNARNITAAVLLQVTCSPSFQ